MHKRNGGTEPQGEGRTGRCRYLQMDLRNVRKKGGEGAEREGQSERDETQGKEKERGVKKRQEEGRRRERWK